MWWFLLVAAASVLFFAYINEYSKRDKTKTNKREVKTIGDHDDYVEKVDTDVMPSSKNISYEEVDEIPHVAEPVNTSYENPINESTSSENSFLSEMLQNVEQSYEGMPLPSAFNPKSEKEKTSFLMTHKPLKKAYDSVYDSNESDNNLAKLYDIDENKLSTPKESFANQFQQLPILFKVMMIDNIIDKPKF